MSGGVGTELVQPTVKIARRRRSSFIDIRKLHLRANHELNDEWVNDHHLNQDGVHIRRDSTCCGKENSHQRTHLFHCLESKCTVSFLFLLLVMDIFFVAFEIAFAARIIPPSFHRDTDEASLYAPMNYVCQAIHPNTEEQLEMCCKANQDWYGEYSPFDDVKSCFDAHNGSSVNLNSAASTHRRLSTSDTGHKRTVRCFDPPPGFKPHHSHWPVEYFLHGASLFILIIFSIELALLVYAIGVQQFFCGCHKRYSVEDTVNVYSVKKGKRQVFGRGKIEHINSYTRDVDVQLNDGRKFHDIPFIMCAVVGPRYCCAWKHFPYVLDFSVVYISLGMEIANTIGAANNVDDAALVTPAMFLILFRWLRFLRVCHGLFEGYQHLNARNEMFQEFENDTTNILSEINDVIVRNNRQNDGQYGLARIQELLDKFRNNYPELEEHHHDTTTTEMKHFK